MRPYVHLSTSKRGSRDVKRQIPTDFGGFARGAFVIPDVGREAEFYMQPTGQFQLDSRPDAVHGGERRPIVRGELTPDGHRLTAVDLPGLSAEDLRAVSIIARRHLPLPGPECDRISDALSALSEIAS